MNIDKRHFTKAERIFARRLQENHIPFKTKIKINGREVDFICGRSALDIDGHEQSGDKNRMLVEAGYVPLHIDNKSAGMIDISFLK